METLPLNIEAITDGRQSTYRNLRRAVDACLSGLRSGMDDANLRLELEAAVRDNSNYGLAVWFFTRDGMKSPPFSELRTHYPTVWNTLVATVFA